MKNSISLVISYVSQFIQQNKILTAVVAYMVFSVLLLSFTGIDICIPCLWKMLIGHNCYGCGLTRAMVALVQLDIKGAYDFNPLIFIILPGVIFYFVWDFIQFKKKSQL